jgi:hypothetical protein
VIRNNLAMGIVDRIVWDGLSGVLEEAQRRINASIRGADDLAVSLQREERIRALIVGLQRYQQAQHTCSLQTSNGTCVSRRAYLGT